jgi:hypothetical protein
MKMNRVMVRLKNDPNRRARRQIGCARDRSRRDYKLSGLANAR